MVSQPRLRLALIGLGRLGVIRARILAFQQPRIELVACCDTKPGADKWAAANLPASVKFFADPEDCMKNSGAEAVLISTATATHAPLICLAFDLGLHVMCEKPISTDVITTEEVVSKAASNPHLKFLLPLSRRYDDSYRAAKLMQKDGSLGEVHAVESQGMDQQNPFFVTFSAQSGGIFVDMGIHDVDIGRYFLEPQLGITNPRKQVNRVFAVGQQAVYPELNKTADCDNGWGMVEFANGKILTIHLGRTLTNGYEGWTRVHGTKAHTVIGGSSQANRVEIRDQHGVRTMTTPDAFILYDKSFLNDLTEFAGAVLDDTPLTCTPQDAFEAGKIVSALQYSFRTRQPVYFDDNGLPIMDTGKTSGSINGSVNASANGYVNGFANGTVNGHTNGVH